MFWVRLEINILRFLPIISSRNTSLLENPIKYFLIQAWGSAAFLSGNFFFFMLPGISSSVASLAMLLKLGAAPFHFWFISILNTCDLWVLFLISTLQKIIPITIFSWFRNSRLIVTIIILSGLTVILSMPGTVRINKVLGLSSIGNLTWMISSCILSLKLLIIFIAVYYRVILGVVLLFRCVSLVVFTQISELPLIKKIIITFMFISLGGLPPFLGFFRKILVIKNLSLWFNYTLPLVLSLVSVAMLYYYLSRLIVLITFPSNLKLNQKSNTSRFFLNSYFFRLSVINIWLAVTT